MFAHGGRLGSMKDTAFTVKHATRASDQDITRGMILHFLLHIFDNEPYVEYTKKNISQSESPADSQVLSEQRPVLDLGLYVSPASHM